MARLRSGKYSSLDQVAAHVHEDGASALSSRPRRAEVRLRRALLGCKRRWQDPREQRPTPRPQPGALYGGGVSIGRSLGCA